MDIPLSILPTLNASQVADSTRNAVDFTWDPRQIPFVVESSKQLFIGWVNQVNVPVYTELNITGEGRGVAYVPHGLNGVAFVALTSQKLCNADDLALATLAGPAIVKIS